MSGTNYAELFEDILKRPGMYVGRRSIIRIRSFMDGYTYATRKEDNSQSSNLYFGFQKFVENRYKLNTTQHSWELLISFMTLSEEEAFERTKELWAKYKAEHDSGN